MGLPKVPEARLYYRAAKQRFDDAQLLLEAGRTTGAGCIRVVAGSGERA